MLAEIQAEFPLTRKSTFFVNYRAGGFCDYLYDRYKVPSTLAPHANQRQYWWYRFSVLFRPCPALYIHSTGLSHRKPQESIIYSLDEAGVLSRHNVLTCLSDKTKSPQD